MAQAIGVDIPDIELVALGQLDNLPDIRLADEPYAYAIRRSGACIRKILPNYLNSMHTINIVEKTMIK
nr:hypothetical protein [Serratia sp. PAMC26656]